MSTTMEPTSVKRPVNRPASQAANLEGADARGLNRCEVDADELVRNISRLIRRETNLGVQEMKVEYRDGQLILSGYCRTFYTKQIAQEAALKLLGEVSLVNKIRVA